MHYRLKGHSEEKANRGFVRTNLPQGLRKGTRPSRRQRRCRRLQQNTRWNPYGMVTQVSIKGWKAATVPYDHGDKLFAAAQIFLVHCDTPVYREAAHDRIIYQW